MPLFAQKPRGFADAIFLTLLDVSKSSAVHKNGLFGFGHPSETEFAFDGTNVPTKKFKKFPYFYCIF